MSRVVTHHFATAVDVLIAGDRVAVHAHAGVSGTVVIVMPWAVFERAARGAADANGSVFPVPVVVGCHAPARTLIEEMSVRPPAPPSGKGRRGWLPPARLEAYRAARRAYEVDGLGRAKAAERFGLKKNSFIGWLRKQRAMERREAVG